MYYFQENKGQILKQLAYLQNYLHLMCLPCETNLKI